MYDSRKTIKTIGYDYTNYRKPKGFGEWPGSLQFSDVGSPTESDDTLAA